MRESRKGMRSGNPGRWTPAALAVLNLLVAQYNSIDKSKGAKQKNKKLKEFWDKATNALWAKFNWEELDHWNIGEDLEWPIKA